MILILSKSNLESSTNLVIDWLNYYDANYFRLNGDDFYNDIEVVNGKFRSLGFEVDKVNVIWNRRWGDLNVFLDENETSLKNISPRNLHSLLYNISSEKIKLRNYLFAKLRSKTWTTHPSKKSLNKLECLYLASQVGLKTPKYVITSKKSELRKFLLDVDTAITKPISEVCDFYYEDKNNRYRLFTLTSVVKENSLVEYPDKFSFSLFQEYIHKDYEIRAFLLDNKIYSMAIISQNDDQTKIDFRNYNNLKPNRTVPYQLPMSIEERILQLSFLLEIKIGSFDILYSKGSYFFLEVNPVGQFGMISNPCNYFLEKKLAQYLIKQDEERFKKN